MRVSLGRANGRRDRRNDAVRANSRSPPRVRVTPLAGVTTESGAVSDLVSKTRTSVRSCDKAKSFPSASPAKILVPLSSVHSAVTSARNRFLSLKLASSSPVLALRIHTLFAARATNTRLSLTGWNRAPWIGEGNAARMVALVDVVGVDPLPPHATRRAAYQLAPRHRHRSLLTRARHRLFAATRSGTRRHRR